MTVAMRTAAAVTLNETHRLLDGQECDDAGQDPQTHAHIMRVSMSVIVVIMMMVMIVIMMVLIVLITVMIVRMRSMGNQMEERIAQ